MKTLGVWIIVLCLGGFAVGCGDDTAEVENGAPAAETPEGGELPPEKSPYPP